MVEDVREEGSAGATVGVQKTEQIQLIRRRSAKAHPLARAMTVRRDTRVARGWLCDTRSQLGSARSV